MTSSLYIGLMSGTSLDGVDAVLVEFAGRRPALLASLHRPLPAALKAELLSLTQPGENEIDRLGAADIEFARLQAAVVSALLESAGFAAHQVTAIGSHGQTVRHRPGGTSPFTLQLGDPNTLAEITGIAVACDFRRRDMAAAGQGAPLVPAFHADCFRGSRDRVIVNIGGMANVTALPGGESKAWTGFDTGPGNVLMDAWCQRHTGQTFDKDGHWARQGKPIPELLAELLADPYFQQAPPKSTGRERFHSGWLDQRLTAHLRRDPADIQATLLQLTARSIADAIRTLPLSHPEVFLCGGGAHNGALVQQIKEALPDSPVGSTAELGLDADWVEAVAFAWLAMRRVTQQPGNLPQVTGARGERILGGLYCA